MSEPQLAERKDGEVSKNDTTKREIRTAVKRDMQKKNNYYSRSGVDTQWPKIQSTAYLCRVYEKEWLLYF